MSSSMRYRTQQLTIPMRSDPNINLAVEFANLGGYDIYALISSL